MQTDEIKDSLADMLLAFQNEAKAIYNSKLMLKDKLTHIGEASAKIVTHETNLDDKQGSFEVIPKFLADELKTFQDNLTEIDELQADIKYFNMLTKACMQKYKEWMIRKTQHAENLESIDEALQALTSDKPREPD